MDEIFDACVRYTDGCNYTNSGSLMEMATWVCEMITKKDYKIAVVSKREVGNEEVGIT